MQMPMSSRFVGPTCGGFLRRTSVVLQKQEGYTSGKLSGFYSEMSTPDRHTVNNAPKKEFKTPLCQELINKSTISGYLPLSQFMKEALMHPHHGYYSAKKHVIGGDKADFITAAEIPLFADVLAAWVIDAWMKMGTPRTMHLVELGPGRGTLMKNMLRQIRHSHPQLIHFLQIHMVEAGAARADEQKKALTEYQTANQKIKWWMNVESIPFTLEPMLFISNEWFDALPIAQFQYTERGWVETCLEVDDDPNHPAHFRHIHAPSGTMAGFLIPEDLRKNGKLGDKVEINAYGMQAIEGLMKKMIDCGKAACLIIDYGKDEHMEDTLRGIRGHKFVDPLLSPGDVDLSAWVSFKQLRWALERLESARRHLKWHPVMTQAEFLEWGGIDIRLAHTIKDEETKNAMRILQSYRRLMDKDEMGESYKVFAFQTKNIPNVSPWL